MAEQPLNPSREKLKQRIILSLVIKGQCPVKAAHYADLKLNRKTNG